MRSVLALALCCLTTISIAQDAALDTPTTDADKLLAPYREAAEKKWSKAMLEIDERNDAETDPADAILFIGSSSIRRWESLSTDLAPYRTIRRGYGGAKFTDMAVFVDRLVTPHQYRGLVMFIGNGVTGKPEDHTPDQIESLARYIVGVSRAHQPEAPVLLLEITPCGKRFGVWHKIRAVNARLREVALSTPHTYFIPTASHFLTPEGEPRTELFVADQLHLNQLGYEIWGTLVRRRLEEVFRAMAKPVETEAEAEVVEQ